MDTNNKQQDETLSRREVLKKGVAAALTAAAVSAVNGEDADAQTERELEAPLRGGGTLLIGNFTDPTSPFPDLFFITDEQLEQFKLSEQEKVEVFRGLRFGSGTFSPLLVDSAFNLGLDGRVASVESTESDLPESASERDIQQNPDTPKDEPEVAAQVDPDLVGPLVAVASIGTVRREVERFITVMT